jgi:hypothetical protein
VSRVRVTLAGLLAGSWVFAAAAQPVPDAVAAKGETVILTVHAEGAQVYDCKTGDGGRATWQFREPIATLIQDGKTVGRHYAGPTWEHVDGSRVVGRPVGRANGASANDVPWLKLEVTDRHGPGVLSGATAIQRINTKGGQHDGPCERAGDTLAVPYSAEYVFLRKP